MVEIKHGQNKKLESSRLLADYFSQNSSLDGKLYIGYPILYTGGENIILDAIWISPLKGIIVFDLVEGTTINNRNEQRDNLYNKIESELRQYTELNKGRNLQIPIEVITFAPACSTVAAYEYTANTQNLGQTIDNQVGDWNNYTDKLYRQTISVIQSVIKLKVNLDRNYLKKTDSKGAIVKRLEETIANLDNQQESAIIEYYDGLQRIRGLAGSGKTIVLALKAAYLHALNPDWNIVVTFNTRALKNQFKELIELFCIQKIGRKPDEDKIRIIQAWGSSSNTGVYYEFCKDNGVEYFNFKSARILGDKNRTTPFDAVCKKALNDASKEKIIEKYDAILVDEAQDLSESFLNLSYRILKGKQKRLIYAYDELQTLHEGSPLGSPKDIFEHQNKFSDIILKKCYRNPRPVLVTAHALGFGIYSKKGLIQFFDQPELWEDLGYLNKGGALIAGQQVQLYRTEEATHKFLEDEIVNVDEIINFNICNDKEEQALRIAKDIQKNITEDELLQRDIIVINPMALTTKDEVALVRQRLNEMGIKSHIAGDVNSDEFFIPNSIAFTGINRAKGNEVPMVYVMNGQDCYSHPIFEKRGLRERRNILFTALTRSKAWVKIYGIGDGMKELSNEFELVKKNDFQLNFTYPSKEQIQRMNVISRDISTDEENILKKDTNSLFMVTEIIERIKDGQVTIEDYPEELQSILIAILGKENEGR